MHSKGKKAKNQVNINNPASILSQTEINRKIAEAETRLKACTWCDLETGGKFTKNEKLTFISDDMLIIGCDIGSDTHFVRAIDTRGRELSNGTFQFKNNANGFERAKAWAIRLAVNNNKHQIVLGLEPTGHYWFCLATWMIINDISVVQVNPYAVKQLHREMKFCYPECVF